MEEGEEQLYITEDYSCGQLGHQGVELLIDPGSQEMIAADQALDHLEIERRLIGHLEGGL